MHKVKGVTLLELVMAISIASLLMLSVSATWISMASNFKKITNSNAVMNNAMLAIQFLVNSVQSGGCSAAHKAMVIGDQHSISITSIDVRHANVVKMMDKKIVASLTEPFSAGDTAVIYNCQNSEDIRIHAVFKSSTHQELILKNPLQHHYQRFAEIAHRQQRTFYAANTKRKAAGKAIYALYERGSRAQELVEGIEELNFLYDVEEGDRLITKPTVSIKEMHKLKGIAVTMKVTSNDHSLIKWWHGYAVIS